MQQRAVATEETVKRDNQQALQETVQSEEREEALKAAWPRWEQKEGELQRNISKKTEETDQVTHF